MKYKVILTQPALADLREITMWIRENDSPESAHHVYDRILQTLNSLRTLPNRGQPCQELTELGAQGFREIRFKPYRIFYDIQDESVYIRLITDGRRNMQELLAKRLLG